MRIEDSVFYKKWNAITTDDVRRYLMKRVVLCDVYRYEYANRRLYSGTYNLTRYVGQDDLHNFSYCNSDWGFVRMPTDSQFPKEFYKMSNNFYRKHKSVLNDDMVLKLFVKYKNFYFASEYMANVWFAPKKVLDKSYCTGTIDCYNAKITRKESILDTVRLFKRITENMLKNLERKENMLEIELAKERRKLKLIKGIEETAKK